MPAALTAELHAEAGRRKPGPTLSAKVRSSCWQATCTADVWARQGNMPAGQRLHVHRPAVQLCTIALLILIWPAVVDANLHLRNFTEADILKCQKGAAEPPKAQRLTITGLPFSGSVLLQVSCSTSCSTPSLWQTCVGLWLGDVLAALKVSLLLCKSFCG